MDCGHGQGESRTTTRGLTDVELATMGALATSTPSRGGPARLRPYSGAAGPTAQIRCAMGHRGVDRIGERGDDGSGVPHRGLRREGHVGTASLRHPVSLRPELAPLVDPQLARRLADAKVTAMS